MIPYHGGPITPETCALRVWKGRHACVSFANPGQLALAVSVCQSVMLDNGAFTYWKQGEPFDHDTRLDYYGWCRQWLRHPAVDWAVIPDVIGGSEAENDALLGEWPADLLGVPVWHLNESIDRLVALADDFPRVALGSAAEYDVSRPTKCLMRLAEALPAISVEGVPMVKLHGLRMLNPAITTQVPLASADSTNVARNIGIDQAWKGSYPPATKEARADVLVERIESHPTPHRLVPVPMPGRLFEHEGAA